MTLAFVRRDDLFKQRARSLLENLTENARYSCQGLVLIGRDSVLGGTSPTLSGPCLFLVKR